MNSQIEMVEEEVSTENQQKNNIWRNMGKNVWSFLKQNYGFFVIPLFILVVFALAYAKFDIWPFGTAIIASYDMLAQVCPILEHFFDVFQGESGLFHSFHVGSGMDMFGILAYCAISPFTPLFLCAGEAGSLLMVSIVLPLKFVCIAISAFIFLRVYFKSIPQYVQIVLAILYACSGYAYVANTYIIWMDIMMYMPIVGAGIIEFSRKGSIKLLVIGFTLNIYACFSITCFSFFTLFPVLVFYVLICKKKEEYRDYLSKLSLAFVVAVALALPVLVPSLVAYTKAGRNTGLFSRVYEILPKEKVLKGELNIHLYEKFTYIFCDSTFIFLTLVYFIRTKKGDKLATFLFVALIYLLIPCLVDESMLLLNMGSYYSYALRFGFLFSLYFLYVSAKAIEQMIESKLDERKISKNLANVSIVVVAILVSLAVIATIVFFDFILDGRYKNAKWVTAIFGSGLDAGPFENYFVTFAHSEGGFEAISVLFIVSMIAFLITAILVWVKRVKIKDIACYLCILALSQTVFFNFSLVKGNRQSASYQKFDCYSEILDEIEEIDEEEFYRLKNYKYHISSNSQMIYGGYSNSFFSSMADAKNITAAKFFGYSGSMTNSTRSNGGTAFSDAFLSYKYVVYEIANIKDAERSYYSYTGIAAHGTPSVKVSTRKSGKTNTVTWHEINKEKHGKGEWSKLTVKVVGNVFYGYLGKDLICEYTMDSANITAIEGKTNNVFGSFKDLVVTDTFGNEIVGDWDFSSDWEIEDNVYTTSKSTNAISFTGEMKNVKTVSARVSFSEGVASTDWIGLSVTTDKGTAYRIVIEPNVVYRVYRNEIAFPSAMVLKGADLNFEGKTKEECYQQIADMLAEGEDFDVEDERISIPEAKKLYNMIKDKGVGYTLTRSGIKVDTIYAEKGQMLLLSYAKLDGYKVYINGKEASFKENSLDLMMIELEEGRNDVEIKYTSPYYKYIAIGVFLAVLMVALAWLVYKKKPIVFNKMSIVLPYMAVAITVLVTAFFFCYPIYVFAKKFFGTYIHMFM